MTSHYELAAARGWRQRRARGIPTPRFVVVELGAGAGYQMIDTYRGRVLCTAGGRQVIDRLAAHMNRRSR